jgi:transposase
LLVQGPEVLAYETPLWTCPWVAHLIEEEFGVCCREGQVWKVLVNLGWSPKRPMGKARERNEEQIRSRRKKTWPSIEEKHTEGSMIVFVDESGVSQRPLR